MPVLHLTEQGATLRLRAGRAVAEVDGEVLVDFPARKVRAVIVHGNARLTTPALQFFLRNRAFIAYVSLEGRLYGVAAQREVPPPHRLRAQFTAVTNNVGAQLARAFVEGKVRSAGFVLRRLAKRAQRLCRHADALEALARRARVEASLERLRGVEGIATRTYFEGIASVLGPYGFRGRSRRPPRDPPNAALSYGYALLLARAWLAVMLAGLHPEVGFLHAETRRNPALALDLMEEFRVPVVDVAVINAFREGVLDAARHFEARDGGVYLNEAGRKRLVRVLERRLNQEARHPDGSKRASYAEMIEYQGVRLAAAVEGRRAYHPFFLEE